MKDLFKQRMTRHLAEMTKYLKYVFNDFFVIALLFLIGGLGLSYSNLLKQLHQGLWWPGIVIFAVTLIAQGFSHLATLIEPADRVFLIPREAEMVDYLKSARRYSVWMALIPQIVIWFVLLPFMRVTMNWNVIDLLGVLLAMIFLKGAGIDTALNQAYDHRSTNRVKWLVNVVALATAIIAPSLGMMISAVYLVRQSIQKRHFANKSLDWRYLIEIEDARMLAVYKFFNLFTDVPNIQATNKRRRYLDFLVNRIKSTPQNVYLSLYGRSIVRNGEYSGLHLRLTLIGAILLVGVGGTYLPILIGLLFIYLIGFQLIPFYFHFSGNVFTHIYPVDQQLQIASFRRVISVMLTISAVIFAITALIGSRSIMVGGLSLLLNLIESWLLTNRFITTKIKQKLN
ncbi:ABC transporter permease [Lactobacillus sp. Sy-1]|uniref:ABC transporter permease n=1 Tax=Lactobacillus sp. Sy-1 TaxID=2109645 RepID=UPI001C57B4DE|nr:ABC transporter permease [Lactobacillus sp. Sy-1]MBW1605712.1 ABC transporter permease [Lactobacillus sp. Sy-1]